MSDIILNNETVDELIITHKSIKVYLLTDKTNGKVYVGQTEKTYLVRMSSGKGYIGCHRIHEAI